MTASTGFAVELYFNGEAEAAVRALWDHLRTTDLAECVPPPGGRPHVSLAVYSQVDVAAAVPRLAAFAETVMPFDFSLDSVGVFPGEEGVVFLAPVVTAELLAVHAGFHRAFEGLDAGEWDYYRPGRWVAHCTVAMGLPRHRVAEVVDLCRTVPLPIRTRFVGVELVHFRPIETLYTRTLGVAAE